MSNIASVEILEDLCSTLKLERKLGESAAEFTERVADVASVCSDKVWDALQEPTQEWVNSCTQAHADGEPLPLLVEEDVVKMEEVEGEEEESIESMSVESEVVEKKVKSKRAKSEEKTKKSQKTAPKSAKKKAEAGAKQGRPPSNGLTLRSACEFYNSLAEQARLKVRKINTTGFSGKPDAAKALLRLSDGLKESGVKPPVELAQYILAFPVA